MCLRSFQEPACETSFAVPLTEGFLCQLNQEACTKLETGATRLWKHRCTCRACNNDKAGVSPRQRHGTSGLREGGRALSAD